VEKKEWAYSILMTFILPMILLSLVSQGYSQFDELNGLEMKTDSVKCKPDTLTTSYDKFKADNLDPQQLGIWYSLAREEYKYKNYKRAIPYYWKVLVNDSTGKFNIVYSKLADCYYNLNQPDSVFIVVYRGLDLYPDNARLHYWAGFVHDVLGQTKCAIPQYEALVKESPEEKSYWEKLSYLYYKEDDPKAIQAQQKVVELEPGNAEASRLLVEIMQHFGEDPIEALKITYLNDTTNVPNAMSYGKALFERGSYKDALVPFNSAITQQPKNTTALEYIGRCYEGLNQLSTALRYYKNILQIEPKNVNVTCLAASVYSRLNDFTTARSYVNKAERIDPESGLPHMVMSEVYENAVTYCSNKRNDNKFTYEDKLVYRLSQEELRKAARDPNYASDAKRRIGQLESLVPTTEDLFMHQNRLMPKDACYNWIK